MALRNIYIDGDPILRKKCRNVEKFDQKLHMLLDDMHETLEKSDGVGLAAPQVGMCKRIFVMHLEDPDTEEVIRYEFVNPEIIKKGGRQRLVEGCLSCPDKWGYVSRPRRVVLKAQDRYGQWFEEDLSELGAQCACHEYDHLEGKLFVDAVEQFVRPEEAQRETEKRRRKAAGR